MTHILHIEASSRHEDSISRQLSNQLLEKLKEIHQDGTILTRDLSQGLPYITDEFIEAMYTPEDERDDEMRGTLRGSDDLIEEIKDADVLVISTPMYNFGPPAVLKSWIDLVVRKGELFHYGEDGKPVGHLTGKKAYVVMATGGVQKGSGMDFLSGWIETCLKFVGITDIEMITAAGTNKANADEVIQAAKDQIDKLAA